MKPNVLSANETLDREFLQIRARILELAALLDRIERGGGTNGSGGPIAGDPRMQRIHMGLAMLSDGQPDRAERVQLNFSLPYDPAWRGRLGLEQ